MACQPQEELHTKIKKGLKLSWLLLYGFRPWYAWLSSYPREIKPEQFLGALRHGSTNITSLETELKDLVIDIASKVNEYVRTMHRSPGAPSRNQAILLYLLTRMHRPKIIVETGVGQGVSTTFLLKGLHDNGEGRLFSIDLPFFEGGSNNPRLPSDEIYPIPRGLKPGWMIPDYLRGRWELLQGDSMELLVPLLNRLGQIDIFLQDDLHTYRHMLLEFRMAWPHINEEGVLLSHDWEKNPALCQFAWENSLPSVQCCRIGCISRLFESKCEA